MTCVPSHSVTLASASSMPTPKNGLYLESRTARYSIELPRVFPRATSHCQSSPKAPSSIESMRLVVALLFASARTETFRPWSVALWMSIWALVVTV